MTGNRGNRTPPLNHKPPARIFCMFAAAACLCLPAAAQRRSASSARRPDPPARTRISEAPVKVCVVVRGRNGKIISGLRRQNFRLYDDGRSQRIADFAENLVTPPPASGAAVAMPRYIALYFDDIHLNFTDIVRATDGAYGYFAKNLGPWDRVGVFTASGQNTLEFTHDLKALHQTLLAIQPHPAPAGGCPKLTGYEAYLVLYMHDPVAREVALEAAQACRDPKDDPPAVRGRPSIAALRLDHKLVNDEAYRVVSAEERRAAETIDGLDRLITRFSSLPDPRSITFISPGFITAGLGDRIDAISSRALRLHILINTVDMSSQITEPSFDTYGLSPEARHQVALAQARYGMLVDGASMAADILTDLPGATGGNFVPNTWSAESAFPMAFALPNSYYVLTYYPRFLTPDGRYHNIRVDLLGRSALYVQARDGYYAPGTPVIRPRARTRRASLDPRRGRH